MRAAKLHNTEIPANGIDILALASAVVLSVGLFLIGFKDAPQGDAASYLSLAQHFADHGLLRDYPLSDVRTYGYPLFLAIPVLIGRALSIDPRIPAFLLQFGIYLSGAWLLRSEVARHSPGIARAVFLGFCLNIFVLVYVAETLTDGLTVALILLLVWIVIRLSREVRFSLVLAGSLLVGAMVMIRPGNIFLLPFWGLAVLLFSWRTRGYGAGFLLLAAAGVALPMLPQVAHNAQYHGVYSPFPTADLRVMQHSLGIMALKYVTLIGDDSFPLVKYRDPVLAFAQRAQVFYENPFQEGRPLVWPTLDWYRLHPVAGAATVSLHVFGLLDQDLIFPYSRTLIPAYRWPVGVLNHLMLALAACGLFVAATSLKAWGVRRWMVGLLSLAYLGGFLGVYAFTVVEARFGLPLIAFAAPLAALGAVSIARQRQRWGAAAVAVCLYVVGALTLSEWIRDQSPTIRLQKQMASGVNPADTMR